LLVCVKDWRTLGYADMGYGVIGDGNGASPFYGLNHPITDPQFTAPQNSTANPPGQVRGGVITSTDTTYLSIAWATNTQAQLSGFLGVAPYTPNQFGSITIRQGSTTVLTRQWPRGDLNYWTSPASTPNLNPSGPKNIWFSRLYVPIGSLATGTYSVDADLEISKPSYDGTTTYQAGPWFSLSGCQLIVS
jgi:hypothetical protein